MDGDDAAWERRSLTRVTAAVRPRKLTKVPFVELADGRPLAQGDPAVVFDSFLRHLSYLELPTTTEPVPELDWFPAGGVD